jgi:carboxyl-terminal processing protease
MALSANDRWTEYFDPDEFKQFDSALDPPDISGIGVLLNVDPKSKCGTAFFVIPQSPADRTGIESGDLITAIDGTPVCGLAQPLISKRLRGTTGSTVNVTVRRGDSTKDFAITRAPVQVPTVYFRMLPGAIAYINVFVFGSPTPAEFSEALRRMQALGARGYILDLRDDGGGYVLSAVSIASHFISSGPIFSTVSKQGEITTDTDAEPPQVSAPLAVLVNQNTASASEITASALQENQVAEVIGTRTFGKGVEQTVSRLPDGSAVKITTARYVTAQNHDLNGVGLQPDLHVNENPSAQFGQIGKDAQLQAALTYLQSKLPS